MTTVLCVSKPIAPPWNDSSKNLVRDLAQGVRDVRLRLCGTRGVVPFERDNIAWEPIYTGSGDFAPGVAQNARMFARLLRPDPGVDIHHYFFAPNPLSSTVLRGVSRLVRKKTVHTVCSMPRDLETARRHLFADRVIAVSDATATVLRDAGVPNVHRIHPCIDPDRLRFDGANPLAAELDVVRNPVVLFAGDIEVEGVVPMLVELAGRLSLRVPRTRLVVAAREKRPDSRVAADALRAQLERDGVRGNTRILGEIARMDQLLALTDIAILPIPTLHRKMDIPLVLLEALALEIPIVVSDLPPLVEILKRDCGCVVRFGDGEALCEAVVSVLEDADRRRVLGENGREVVLDHFSIGPMARAYEALYEGLTRE